MQVLLTLHREITTIIQNVNGKYTSMVLGQSEVLYGPGTITDVLCGCKFRISSQIILPDQSRADGGHCMGRQWSLPDRPERKSAGRLLRHWHYRHYRGQAGCRQVTGVEVNRDAVKDAITNARKAIENYLLSLCGRRRL